MPLTEKVIEEFSKTTAAKEKDRTSVLASWPP